MHDNNANGRHGEARKVAHPVDVAAGANMRRLRRMRGITQEGLAERVGLTFQQIQKYERGANRMSCSRLVEIAHALGIPPARLLPESDRNMGDAAPRWVEQAEALHFQHAQLLDTLLRLSPRQVNALSAVAESMLSPHEADRD